MSAEPRPRGMRVFLDTEFIDDGRIIELISIGLVRGDGKTLYLENSECDLSRASDWVRRNVVPHLEGGETCVPRGVIAHWVRDFVGERSEIWGYYPSYDWVVLCQLYGTMMDLPEGWPMMPYDLRQWLDHHHYRHVRQPDDAPHHALSDARWIRDTFMRFAC